MTKYPHLTNAPITEALIDFRVKLSTEFEVKNIDLLYESISELYPEKQEQRLSEIQFKPDQEELVKTSAAKIIGYRYISPDKRQIVQARIDGFTFSRLKPYVKWEQLRDEAYRLWQYYKKITAPESITRVALRYINNLNIPMPIKDFSDYLKAPPIVPEELPQEVPSFLTRIVIKEPDLGVHAIITQALERIVNDVAPIILDIDVFKYQPEGIEEKEAWDLIERLRDFKNDIFFSSITERLLEMYK